MVVLYYSYSKYSIEKRILLFILIPFLSLCSPLFEVIVALILRSSYENLKEDTEIEQTNSSEQNINLLQPQMADFNIDDFKIETLNRFKNGAGVIHDLSFFIPSIGIALLLFKNEYFEYSIFLIIAIILIWYTFAKILSYIYKAFYGKFHKEGFLDQLINSRDYLKAIQKNITEFKKSEYEFKKFEIERAQGPKIAFLKASMKPQLSKDFQYFDKKGDWMNRQRVKLKLIWLESVKDTEVLVKRSGNPISEVPKVRMDKIDFLHKWDLNDYYTYPFAEKILAEYGKVLENNKDNVLLRDESVLPVDKTFIKKAIYYSLDYLELENAFHKLEYDHNRKYLLKTINIFLDKFFVSDSDNKDAFGGGKSGIDSSDYEYLDFVDWRSEEQWLLDASIHSVNGADDTALAILGKALQFYPLSTSLISLLGITHLNIAEEKLEKNEKQLAIDSFKKAAKLGNDEAIKWLEGN